MDQMDPKDIHRICHPTAEDYTFSSSTDGTFSRITPMLGHKIRLKFKKIKIIPSIFSDYNGIKLEMNNS